MEFLSQAVYFFISFFPQLVSGPIVKASDFLPQITQKYILDIPVEAVFKNLILGYFLKMVVADNLQEFTSQLSAQYIPGISSLTLLFFLFGYSVQIFSDFAGYSLIAIGTAALFGYRIPINFNFPYTAVSISDFWRRWHISLSAFLKEYLYIPIGGNRISSGRTYTNILITMTLGGLWHGAAWSYVLWGIYHGAGLILERIASRFISLPDVFVLRTARRIFIFIFITAGWLFFKLSNFKDVIIYFNSLASNILLEDDTNHITYITLYSIPVFLYHLRYLTKHFLLIEIFSKKIDFIFYGLMLYLILTNSGTSGDFIYFQF